MLNDEKKTFEKKIDAVDSTVKENVKSMEEVFKFSVKNSVTESPLLSAGLANTGL